MDFFFCCCKPSGNYVTALQLNRLWLVVNMSIPLVLYLVTTLEVIEIYPWFLCICG